MSIWFPFSVLSVVHDLFHHFQSFTAPITDMTQRVYYTRCSCATGRLSVSDRQGFLMVHIHLPPHDESNEYPPPSDVDMTRQNDHIPCQCSTERTHLHGRPDIISVHFDGLPPTNAGEPVASTTVATPNPDTREGLDLCWAVKRTTDSKATKVSFTSLLYKKCLTVDSRIPLYH